MWQMPTAAASFLRPDGSGSLRHALTSPMDECPMMCVVRVEADANEAEMSNTRRAALPRTPNAPPETPPPSDSPPVRRPCWSG